MDMEVVGETMGSNDQVSIMKGRRTKRPRPSSPFSLASSSSVGGSSSGDHGHDRSSSSPVNSFEFGERNDEEEDMANCLILLAQGYKKKEPKKMDENGAIERCVSRKNMEATTTGKEGLYVYQCKTCNRCFPSFQALGGHRASHRKPKAAVVEERKALVLYEDVVQQFNISSPPLPHHMGNKTLYSSQNRSKVHECSICGSEFSSGQALGGHMRRHRTPTNTTMAMAHAISESQESKKPRTVLALDLNLPAPEEEDENNFTFSPHIFSATSLVDCHY